MSSESKGDVDIPLLDSYRILLTEDLSREIAVSTNEVVEGTTDNADMDRLHIVALI